MRRLRSLCLKALVPPQNYKVSTNPQSHPIETNQRKDCPNPLPLVCLKILSSTTIPYISGLSPETLTTERTKQTIQYKSRLAKNVSTKSTVYSSSPSFTFFSHFFFWSISSQLLHLLRISSPYKQIKAMCLPVSIWLLQNLQVESLVSSNLFCQLWRFSLPVLCYGSPIYSYINL